jgi:hypothetical protein
MMHTIFAIFYKTLPMSSQSIKSTQLKIADTQFASSFTMLKRLREVKTALVAMVILEFGSFWRKMDQISSKRSRIQC